jgi:hypothetical protein
MGGQRTRSAATAQGAGQGRRPPRGAGAPAAPAQQDPAQQDPAQQDPAQQDPAQQDQARRNRDVDWNTWPVQTYLAENYRRPHPSDLAVIEHHARFYGRMGHASIARSLEFGAGPNLYPLMLAASVSRSIHAVEPSQASVAYLDAQVHDGVDESWSAFYAICRGLLPDLPPTPDEALSIVEVSHASAAEVRPDAYDLASMHFVAESVTEDLAEFSDLCHMFVHSVRPGGALVAAFMENMGRYHLGDGSTWPGVPVDVGTVTDVFGPLTTELEVTRIDADPTLPDYGYTGMVLMTARRHAPPAS